MNGIAELMAHSDSGPLHRILRLKHSGLASAVRPGHQLQIGDLCLPLLRSNTANDWVEVLYLRDTAPQLAKQEVGTSLAFKVISQTTFQRPDASSTTLLIADADGLANILFLSTVLASQKQPPTLVLLGTQSNFPFRPHPSHIMLPQLPAHAIATLPLLEDKHIACRLAHTQGMPGCYDGSVSALAQIYLENKQPETNITILASGTPTLAEEIKILAKNFSLPYQFLGAGR